MLTFSRKSALLASAVADAEAMSPRACNRQQLNIFNSFSCCDLVQCGHLVVQRGSVEWLSLECPRMGYKVLRWDTNPWDTIQSRTYLKSKPINLLGSHTTASSGEKASLSARHFFSLHLLKKTACKITLRFGSKLCLFGREFVWKSIW